MAYVGFSDGGYECFDAGRYLLFSEDNSHEFLFHYVSQDLSCLPILFAQYVSQRMDTSTFMLYDCPDNEPTIEQIENVLVAAHPYYKHEARGVLIRAIGDYFNDLLLYACYHCHTLISNFSEAWYMKRITTLLAPLLMLGDTYPEDFYREYQRRIGGDSYTAGASDDEIETAILGVPRERPAGLTDEIRTQCEIYNMLYFLLDISAQGLEELTIPQRIWLYNGITVDSGRRVTIPKLLSLKHPILSRPGHGYSQAVEHSRELDEKFCALRILEKSNIGRDGVSTEIKETLRSVIDYAKSVTISKPYEEYEITSLYQLLYLEILSMIQDKVLLRKCRRCGKYFVVTNRKTAYCDRADESGVYCSVVGSQQAFQHKMETDEPLRVYNRAYKTHHARVRKGTMSRDAFQSWCDEAKAKLVAVRAGELDIATFQAWLKK